MSSAPRILPLVAVAMGGVLAVKALSGVQSLPELFSTTPAHAEEAPRKGSHRAAVQPSAPASSAPVIPAAVVQPRPTPACAQSPIDLAREAGVSPGELQALQNLKARRGQLDDREKALDTQIQLLAAAETKVDAKLAAVQGVKAQVQALLGQADSQQQADVDRLTLVYQKMKPRDAAAVMATLDDKVRIPVAAKMKDAALAAILAQMPTVEAKKLTESLAERTSNAKQALAAATQAPPPAPNPAAQSSDPLAAPPPAAEPKSRRAHRRKLASAAVRPHTPTEKAAAALAPEPAATPAAAAKMTAALPSSAKPMATPPAKTS